MKKQILYTLLPLFSFIPFKSSQAESFRKEAGVRFQVERNDTDDFKSLIKESSFSNLEKIPQNLRAKIDQDLYLGFSFNQKPRMGIEFNF